MKKLLAYSALSLSILLSVLIPPVAAISEPTTTSNTETVTTSSEEKTQEDKTKRDARLETYKKSLKEALTAAVKTRLTERCVAAQTLVKVKSTNNQKATTARSAIYAKIVSNLEAVVAGATVKGIDVTTLEANITVLKTKIATFDTANTTYQQALADLSALECKTDPTAFKAALETARTDQIAVNTAAKAIRAYLTDTVKLTLKALKAQTESTN